MSEWMTIDITCNMCGEAKRVEVPTEGYTRWKTGELIQRAMPMLSRDDRELLISGTCGKCFEELFTESDEGG